MDRLQKLGLCRNIAGVVCFALFIIAMRVWDNPAHDVVLGFFFACFGIFAVFSMKVWDQKGYEINPLEWLVTTDIPWPLIVAPLCLFFAWWFNPHR